MTAEPSGSTYRMGVVVVNYASSGLLSAHRGLQGDRLRVVVVDNFSSSAEREAVRRIVADHGWALVEMDGNPGFGAGVNAGVARAAELGCDCFLLLNPDAVVTPDTVEALRRACQARPDAVVSPRLLDPDGRVVFAGSVLNLADGRNRRLGRPAAGRGPDRPVPWLTAACLAVPRPLWELAGGFAEDYFMYWEDVDFAFRCRAVGGEAVLREDLVAHHDQGGTQGPRRGRAKSALYYYYNCRNRLLFGVRHLAGRRQLWDWLRHTPRVSWEILLHGGRRQLVHHPRLALAAARGGLDGALRAVPALIRGRIGPVARPGRPPSC